VLGSPCVHEVVAGITFRISGLSFFQANTAGAAALVDLVADALAPGPDDGLVDAFAGVGLFAATVGAAAGRVSAIELAPTAVADLAHNLDTAGIEADVLVGDFTTRLGDVAGPVDLLVVDPPRVGLRADGVAAAVEAGPAVMAYVSCDPAALARDAALLAAAGYRLDWVTPVDLFPQTWHIEAVARFSKGLTR
jgi:23S rRNA (uracil1939-C5)-methyltransferase